MAAITIRKEHVELLAANNYRRYEDRLLATVADHYPELVALHGEVAIRNDIRDAILVADGLGLRTERSAAYFVLLVFQHGRDFDSRPEHASLARTLRDSAREPDARARAAYELSTIHTAGSSS